MRPPFSTMRYPTRSTRNEIKQKLITLYSNSLDSGRNVLDFDKPYDFFSTDESLVLKFSSNWFYPERNFSPCTAVQSTKHYQTLGIDDGGNQKAYWPLQKQESLLKIEKSLNSSNQPRDLEVLGRTPYQIGVDGEKFRVVAATLQKCNSPFVRRTFHFTSNGIIEAPEKKPDSDCLSVTPMMKQKTAVQPQKFVRIRRFRVIKKDDLAVEKYILPQKIKITNGEKTRFLTVRFRPKNSNIVTSKSTNSIDFKPETSIQEIPKIIPAAEKVESENETSSALFVQTEEHNETEQVNQNTSEAETSSASLDPTEEEMEEKMEEMRQMKQNREEQNEQGESFNCENCGKQFLNYLSCLAHIRSHQRQACQFCSKRFLTMRMLRDHMKIHHQHRIAKPGSSEDRITTATSKFGRTRQVLNVAGLRSKYKML